MPGCTSRIVAAALAAEKQVDAATRCITAALSTHNNSTGGPRLMLLRVVVSGSKATSESLDYSMHSL